MAARPSQLGPARPGCGWRWQGTHRARPRSRRSERASHKGAGEGRAIGGRRGPEPRRGGAPAPAIPPPSPPSAAPSARPPAPPGPRPPLWQPLPAAGPGPAAGGPGRDGTGGGLGLCPAWVGLRLRPPLGPRAGPLRCLRGTLGAIPAVVWQSWGRAPPQPRQPLRVCGSGCPQSPSSPVPAEWKLSPRVCGGTNTL